MNYPKGLDSIADKQIKGDDMSKGKELTVKEAYMHMFKGGECDASYSNGGVYAIKWKIDSVVYVDDQKTHLMGDASGYYIHEKTPELLEGVGKMGILKSNNQLQLVIEHIHDRYKLGSNEYDTIDEVKEHWHIVE